MKRRRWLQWGCAHCAALSALAWSQGAEWQPPPRFTRPDIASEEGGLWALLDREETRLRRSPFRLHDETLEKYLTEVARRLAGEHAADLRIYAMRTPMFNASMAPNGMMQLWSGLLLRMENEAQLAAVVGHEIGHYLQRHALAQLRDAKSRSAMGSVMLMFGLLGALGALATAAGSYGFSREQETEADAVGVVLMRRAGYDPTQAARVWANLLDEVNAAPEGDAVKTSPMFATHPASAERRATLENLGQGGSGERREAEYRASIARQRFGMLEDEVRRARFDETLALLDRMTAQQPEDAELLHFRGEARRQRAKDADAELALADFEAALKTGREPAITHRSLGLLHRAQGRRDAALAAFARYVERAPQAPDAALIQQNIEELRS